jgi:hypothetical protein
MSHLRRDSVFVATEPLPAARAAEMKAHATAAISTRLNARTVICMDFLPVSGHPDTEMPDRA